jgi:hypothetical protein
MRKDTRRAASLAAGTGFEGVLCRTRLVAEHERGCCRRRSRVHERVRSRKNFNEERLLRWLRKTLPIADLARWTAISNVRSPAKVDALPTRKGRRTSLLPRKHEKRDVKAVSILTAVSPTRKVARTVKVSAAAIPSSMLRRDARVASIPTADSRIHRAARTRKAVRIRVVRIWADRTRRVVHKIAAMIGATRIAN